MADPHHVPEMDGFDRLTVALYRTGLLGQAGALGLFAASEAEIVSRPVAALALLATVALSVGNLHLYDKRIRWIIGTSAWIGAVLVAASLQPGVASAVLHYAGLGFLCVVTSALALKERYCFKLPGLQTTPALLGIGVFTGLFGFASLTAGLVGLAAALVGLLAAAKLRMPVHYDIGNKAAYQI